MSTLTLVNHNIAYLRQAIDLLQELDDGAYTEQRPPVYNSGIGEHLRHIVEHYQCFLAGLSSGRIDYDGRRRDRAISSSTSHASLVITEVIEAMRSVPEADVAVSVCLDGSSTAADDDPWSSSTIRRELQYLQAHTVHHYALIAFILRLQDRATSPDFGVAPSTLRHRSTAAG